MVQPTEPRNLDADRIDEEAGDLGEDADALERRTDADETDEDDEGVGDVGGLVP